MGVEHLSALTLGECRALKCPDVENLASVVSSDGLEQVAELSGAELSFDSSDGAQYRCLSLIRNLAADNTSSLSCL
jgi:hypothetical protein